MKTIFTAVILGFTAMLHAQHVLSGTVSDSANVAIPGVSVFVHEINKGTVTDQNGSYTLANLPTRNLTITFSYLGYVPTNKVLRIDSATTLDIILETDIHQMDEVIVSTAFNRLQSQNVMKVEHRNIETLRQKGISTLIDGIATIPGVSQISTGASIGKPVIRGLSSNRVLVYSQGVRLENQQFGDEHGLGLNDSGVESVEVIKGPASLLYGSDALGGVLYFNPEKFAKANTITADVNQRFYSNTLGSNLSAGVKGSTENWRFLGRGSHATHSDYELPDGSKVTNTRFNESDFKGAVGFSANNYTGTVRYNFNRLDIGIPEGGVGEQSDAKKTLFPKQAVDNHIISFQNKIYIGGLQFDADFGHIVNDRKEFEEAGLPALHMKLHTTNYDVKLHLAKSAHLETIAGIQGMHQQNKNFADEYLIPDAITNDIGAFVTATYDWANSSLQAGIRYDNRNVNTDEFGIAGEQNYFAPVSRSFGSFNQSIGYKNSRFKNVTVRVNVASGFRAPNLAELTSNGVHEGTNRYEVGSGSLTTEQNYQADINVEYRASHFEFFVNGFYNHINDYIYAAPNGEVIDDNAVFEYVQNDARLFGGEAAVHFHPHPLDWLHIESAFESVTGKNNNGDYLPLIPANTWTNTVRSEFGDKKSLSNIFARIDAVSTFSQRNVSGAETATDGYTLVNMGFGVTMKFNFATVDFSINGNNLLNESYTAHLSRLKTDGIANIGRNIIVGLHFTM